MSEFKIRPLGAAEEPPRDLLLLADESPEAVEDYLARGLCYVGEAGGSVTGEYVLLPTRPFTAELVNVAVAEVWQGRGFGKRLVGHAIGEARKRGFKRLEVGTGNCGIAQIALYQKCGFTMTHIDVDFFTALYPEPFCENGIECRHMVRMKIDL